MSNPSRFVIGIDLGTTNTALSYVDTAEVDAPAEFIPVREFAVPQVIAPGAVEARAVLPSAIYLASGPELPPDSLHLPWRAEQHAVLGTFAREQGAKVPARLVHSSKSWLCHGGVAREDAILPWQSPEDVGRISPVEAAAMVLRHLREAWDHTIPRGDGALSFSEQEITLCVPASFDAEARNLTVKAAEQAGLVKLHLLEEPQAALYSWVETAGRHWRRQVRAGDLVLVVDVGGGTADFSLIAVTGEDGELQLRRVAVGEHILLGGDNMDLALAFSAAERLEQDRGTKLSGYQLTALTQQCRMAKEALLTDASLAEYPLILLGRGSSLVGGTIRTELKREGLNEFLLEGFFPQCAFEERPARPKRAGFREAGLPYANDARITRHLARFLGLHQDMAAEALGTEAGKPAMPSAILFKGGVFRAEPLRRRVLEVVSSWCAAAGCDAPRVLEGTNLDLAVSRGAAYLGVARRGHGIRIRGGSARSYYVGFEAPAPAVPGMAPPIKLLCVVPHGLEEGSAREISGREMDLCMWTGEPVEFRFFSSTSRRADQPGSITDFNTDEFQEHSPLETTVGDARSGQEGEAVEVDLRSHLTEIGVLEIHCVHRGAKDTWKLEFNVRHQDESVE
ncbi:Hsp70 family protein [Candidatus Poribacteria bacterium]|nr:Hsp70 family protein [Candidatus Poribacteria bacterium]